MAWANDSESTEQKWKIRLHSGPGSQNIGNAWVSRPRAKLPLHPGLHKHPLCYSSSCCLPLMVMVTCLGCNRSWDFTLPALHCLRGLCHVTHMSADVSCVLSCVRYCSVMFHCVLFHMLAVVGFALLTLVDMHHFMRSFKAALSVLNTMLRRPRFTSLVFFNRQLAPSHLLATHLSSSIIASHGCTWLFLVCTSRVTSRGDHR
jgi:hypothetical protein